MNHIYVKCPYCNHKTCVRRYINEDKWKNIETCCLEDGGCDKDFVVQGKVIVKIKTGKIEMKE